VFQVYQLISRELHVTLRTYLCRRRKLYFGSSSMIIELGLLSNSENRFYVSNSSARVTSVLLIRYNFFFFFCYYTIPDKLALDASQHSLYISLLGDSVKKCDNGKFVTCLSRLEYEVNF